MISQQTIIWHKLTRVDWDSTCKYSPLHFLSTAVLHTSQVGHRMMLLQHKPYTLNGSDRCFPHKIAA